MKLVAAKCPNCGANIEVSPDAETTRCKSCGSAILVEDAIQKYKIEVSGEVSLSGISSVENDINLGKQCLAALDWKTAYKVYSGAIDKKSDCFEAWNGLLSALTQNFTWADKSWVQIEGIKGLRSVVENCFNYANTTENKNNLVLNLKRFICAHENKVAPEIKNIVTTKKGSYIFPLVVLLASIVFSFSMGWQTIVVMSPIAIIGGIVIRLSVDKSQKMYLENVRNIIQKYIQ